MQLEKSMTETGENKKNLLIAVIQTQDVESTENAIEKIGVSVVRLPSIGGFLGRRNVTLLIGLPSDKSQGTIKAIHENCRQRIEFIAVPMESAPLPIPTPTPVTIGGATVFSIEVEHYEEI